MSRSRNNNNNNNNKVTRGSVKVSTVSKGTTFGINPSTETIGDNFGKVNYSYFPGTPILRDFRGGDTGLTQTPASAIPGIMSIPFIPTIGYQDGTSQDPINLAASEIYTKVRQANSGSKNYDQNNLMIHIMGMDSIYSFHAWMIRVYTIIQMYSKDNYYIPEVLAQANQLNIDDFQENITQFLGYINLFAKRGNKLAVPNVIPLITDHARMCNWIYMDDESMLGQMYAFYPTGFYKYEENESSGTKFGTLQWYPMRNSGEKPLTFAEVKAYGNQLLEDMLNSQDMSTMNGDILKAYPMSSILEMPYINEDINLEMHYDDQVLLAIHNADFSPYDDINVGAITANATNNNITQNITLTASKDNNSSNYPLMISRSMVDQYTDAPTLEDNYTAIRFKHAIGENTPSDKTAFAFYGTEILCSPQIWYYAYDQSTKAYKYSWLDLETTIAVSGTGESTLTSLEILDAIKALTPFDKCPLVYYGALVPIGSYYIINRPEVIGTFHNPTVVDNLTIRNMMLVYTFTAFGV